MLERSTFTACAAKDLKQKNILVTLVRLVHYGRAYLRRRGPNSKAVENSWSRD